MTDNKTTALLILWACLGSGAGPVLGDPSETEPERELLQPEMRPVDRDWTFFAGVPCQDLQRLRVHSQAEHRLLQRRQQQCLDAIRSFSNTPVSGGQTH